jgi:hypothetical protein
MTLNDGASMIYPKTVKYLIWPCRKGGLVPNHIESHSSPWDPSKTKSSVAAINSMQARCLSAPVKKHNHMKRKDRSTALYMYIKRPIPRENIMKCGERDGVNKEKVT